MKFRLSYPSQWFFAGALVFIASLLICFLARSPGMFLGFVLGSATVGCQWVSAVAAMNEVMTQPPAPSVDEPSQPGV